MHGLKHDVKQFIRDCEVCQINKLLTTYLASLFQPLLVPYTWTNLSIGFIEGIPLSNGYSVIMVVVDRLLKYSHFMALKHPFTSVKVAITLFENFLKLHGKPANIVNGSTSVSYFWKELFRLQGVSLAYYSAYHPQSDGQSEVVNNA